MKIKGGEPYQMSILRSKTRIKHEFKDEKNNTYDNNESEYDSCLLIKGKAALFLHKDDSRLPVSKAIQTLWGVLIRYFLQLEQSPGPVELSPFHPL
jgi:hypothetical protein